MAGKYILLQQEYCFHAISSSYLHLHILAHDHFCCTLPLHYLEEEESIQLCASTLLPALNIAFLQPASTGLPPATYSCLPPPY